MTARPIRYQRQVSDRNGKIFYTSIASLSHISKMIRNIGIKSVCFEHIQIRSQSENPAVRKIFKNIGRRGFSTYII